MLDIWIRPQGQPAPQGSMRGYVRGNRAVLVPDNKRLMPWRETMSLAIWQETQMRPDWADAYEKPIGMTLWFYLERPKTVRRVEATGTYDVDKLARAVLDACQGLLFANDNQVCELNLRKQYADDLSRPGVQIHAWRID